jgi:hypothetical protein
MNGLTKTLPVGFLHPFFKKTLHNAAGRTISGHQIGSLAPKNILQQKNTVRQYFVLV